MDRAVPCRVCKTDLFLQWKTYSETGEWWIAEMIQWWIHCDKCGHIGTAGMSQTQAGENWNRENEKAEIKS